MNVLDLFCGVGGMSLGFEGVGFKTVLGVEKDASIASAFKANNPEAKCLIGDISQLSIDDYLIALENQRVDVIIGGPPCQGFSQKGKRLSLNDDRNFLFKHFVATVSELKPVAFVIENVPNLLSSAKGYFFAEIKNAFEELGYSVVAKVLLASDYGVPQNRRRAFIIGILGNHEFRFPEIHKEKITISDALSDLPTLRSGEGSLFVEYERDPLTSYQKRMRRNSAGIYNHISTNHSQLALKRLSLIPENGGKEHLPSEHITKSIYSGTWTRLRSDEQAPTITTRFDTPSSGQFTLPTQNRCITVREAARLQSFPDSFIFTGSKGSQMLQVGNAVPPLMAQSIATSLMLQLDKILNKQGKGRAA